MNSIASLVLAILALVIVYFVSKPVLRFVRPIIPLDWIKQANAKKVARAAITSFVYNALALIAFAIFGMQWRFLLPFIIVLVVEYIRDKD